MIWRKHYRSMYEGSMVGSGAVVFALMGYIITHQEFIRGTSRWVIRLNPVLIGAILGEKPGDVSEAIEFLCKPDAESTSKEQEGRRLVPMAEGSMEYWVVNGDKYQEMRDYEDRKLQNREAQRRWREKQKEATTGPDPPPEPQSPGSNGRFQPPSQEDCRAHAVTMGLPEAQANAFWHFYESKGWKVGRNPMKSWHSAMAGWKTRFEDQGGKTSGAPLTEADKRRLIHEGVERANAKYEAEQLGAQQ